jgi:RNA polymerase sigma factor (TIGR02999 family)
MAYGPDNEEVTVKEETIGRLIVRWNNGDKTALDELSLLVAEDVRRLASYYMRGERRNHTLQTTALINEAYLRLINTRKISSTNKGQFMGLISKMMRHVLTDYAREHNAAKRRGDVQNISLSAAAKVPASDYVDFEKLNTCLNKMEADYPENCRVVELRFFGGYSIEKTAEALRISASSVERYSRFAEAWIRACLNE